MIAASAAAVVGLLQLKKRRSGDAEDSASTMIVKSNSSKPGLGRKKSPVSA
jgi:hypothetical protein